MARHVVCRRNGEIDQYQELPDNARLEPHFVTVTFPAGSLHSYHVKDGLGGVGFEFAEAGILVLRFEDSDHMLSALAATAWTSVSGTALSATAADDPPAAAKGPEQKRFGKDTDGSWLWPRYLENSRVLKLRVERLDGQAAAMPNAIGNLPTRECHSTSAGWTSTIAAGSAH